MIPRYKIETIETSDRYRRTTRFNFRIIPNFKVKTKIYQWAVEVPDYYGENCRVDILKYSMNRVLREFKPIKKALNMGLAAGLRLGKKLYKHSDHGENS